MTGTRPRGSVKRLCTHRSKGASCLKAEKLIVWFGRGSLTGVAPASREAAQSQSSAARCSIVHELHRRAKSIADSASEQATAEAVVLAEARRRDAQGHTPRSPATAAGTPLIGHRKLLPTVTNRHPRVVQCSTITPLAATRAHALESFLGQARAAYFWFTVEIVTT